MQICNKTSIVFNEPSKILGLPPFYYRYRTGDTNLNGNTPADQYLKQKLIQNTVRVPASLYTANLGPLTAYTPATRVTHNVCWNQMSDRPVPSVQRVTVPTGSNTTMNRRHTSVTSSRPGCQTPGGAGCDIKHNSYDRYLNRLKGKGPLKRGVVPPYFGTPFLPYNAAFPIQGAKVMKTNIVATKGCSCGNLDAKLYNNPYYQPVPQVDCNVYQVGQHVYAMQTGNLFYTEAVVMAVGANNTYTIQFVLTKVQEVKPGYELKRYFPCNCNYKGHSPVLYTSVAPVNNASAYGIQCVVPTDLLERLGVGSL